MEAHSHPRWRLARETAPNGRHTLLVAPVRDRMCGEFLRGE
jgi:hypothetical protein